jgi:diguanylate cyclase (GGDEF)-like protein
MSTSIHILLVDDNSADARLIRDYLSDVKDFHFELTHANQVKTGLEYLSGTSGRPDGESSFDIILLDLGPPDCEDLAPLRCIRAQTHLPIIVQSCIDEGELAQKALQAGAQDFLIKEQLSATLLVRALRHAVERQRYEAARQRHAREMEALYANTLEISSQLDLKTVLHSIVERAARLLAMQMGGLYLVSTDNQHLQLAAGYHLSEDLIGATLKIGEGLAGRVAETGEAISVEDYHNWQDRSTIYEQVDIRRVLAVPLKSNQAVIGVLDVCDYNRTDPFDDEEIHLLTLFADQASNAVQNARLFEAARQHARQMVLLNEIAQAAIRTPAFQVMLETAAARFSELINAEGIYITLWDEVRQQARIGAAHGFLKQVASTLEFEPGETTLTDAVLQEGYPIIVDKADTSPYLSPRLAALFPAKTLLSLPLIVDGRKLGAVLTAFDSPHPFSLEEMVLCEQAANQVALAVAKAHLLQAESQRSRELARSNSLIGALSQVSSHLESELDPRKIMSTVGAELDRLDITIQIALLDPLNGNLNVEYTSIASQQLWEFTRLTGLELDHFQMPENLWPVDKVIKDKAPLYIENLFAFLVANLPEAPESVHQHVLELMYITKSTSGIFLPMIIKEQVIGMIGLWSNDLQAKDVPAFQVFANQMAVAIENSRLFGQIQTLAIIDDLTGLYNRRGFFTLAEQQVKLASRLGHSILLVFMDMDRLKQINDDFGHQQGDLALVDLARLLRQSFRNSDIIARIGGDEFVVLAINANGSDATVLIDRLRKRMSDLNNSAANPYHISVSIGTSAWLPGGPINLDELLARADSQMYKNKRRHRL